jgi:hypothetical protein
VFNGKDGHAYARIGKQWARLLDGAAQPVAGSEWPGEVRPALKDGRLLLNADISGDYTLVRNATGEQTSHHFDYEGAGSSPFVVGVGPEGDIYGSTAMPLLLFRHNVDTSENEDLGNPTEVGGEIYSMVPLDEKLYVCAYPGSYLSVYDPSQPWDFGTEEGKNPRGYGRLGDGHLRPQAMIVGPDDKLYIGSLPPYGQLGGAMGVFDPVEWKLIENYRNIIPNQSITALAYDEASGLVFGGSNIAGGGGSTPSEQDARFYVWDPAEKKKLDDFVPHAGDTGIVSMAVARGKVFFISTPSASLHVYDIAQRKLIDTRPIGMGVPLVISLGLHSDGLLYGLTSSSIFSVDPLPHEIKQVAAYEGGISCGWAMTEDGVYFGSHVHLIKYAW